MNTTDHRRWLRDWVAATAGSVASGIDDATPLFADGWLDSTDFVEVLLAVEDRAGRPIAAAEITPDAFLSIDAILLHFFTETDHADRTASNRQS